MTFTLAEEADTRMVDNETNAYFEEGDQVAILCDGITKIYTVSTVNGQQMLTSDDPHYWDSATGTKTITAWYPTTAWKAGSYTSGYVVNRIQTSEKSWKESNILGTDATVMSARDMKPLVFKHRAARITINLSQRDGGQMEEITSVSVRADYTLSQDIAPNIRVRPSDIMAYRVSNEKWEAYVPAQSMKLYYQPNGITYPQPSEEILPMFTIKGASGNDYGFYYNEEGKDITYFYQVDGGKKYTFNVTLNNDETHITLSDDDLNIRGTGTYHLYGNGETTGRIHVTGGSPTIYLHEVNIRNQYPILITGGAHPVFYLESGTHKMTGIDDPNSGIIAAEGSSITLIGRNAIFNVPTATLQLYEGSIGTCSAYQNCGDIYIENINLTVNRTTGVPYCAQGIGSGGGTCGNITIKNCYFDHVWGYPAIGASSRFSPQSSCGDILLDGCSFNKLETSSLKSDRNMQTPVIGSGYAYEQYRVTCGNITITNRSSNCTSLQKLLEGINVAYSWESTPVLIGTGVYYGNGISTCGTINLEWTGGSLQKSYVKPAEGNTYGVTING